MNRESYFNQMMYLHKAELSKFLKQTFCLFSVDLDFVRIDWSFSTFILKDNRILILKYTDMDEDEGFSYNFIYNEAMKPKFKEFYGHQGDCSGNSCDAWGCFSGII